MVCHRWKRLGHRFLVSILAIVQIQQIAEMAYCSLVLLPITPASYPRCYSSILPLLISLPRYHSYMQPSVSSSLSIHILIDPSSTHQSMYLSIALCTHRSFHLYNMPPTLPTRIRVLLFMHTFICPCHTSIPPCSTSSHPSSLPSTIPSEHPAYLVTVVGN